jgi:TolB protein
MTRWLLALLLHLLPAVALLTGAGWLAGRVTPARLLSYPQGDVERGAYFIQWIDVGRGLEARFSPVPVGYCCLNWSPDGRYLMTLSPAADGTPGRYELILFERETRQVVWASGDIGYTTGITAWSPGSDRLLYDSNAQGSGEQRLYMLTLEDRRFSTAPLFSAERQENQQLANTHAWSADGRWIVYGLRPVQTPIYHLVDLESGQSWAIPQGEQVREPTFAPNGSALAFIRGTVSESQLVITTADCLRSALAGCAEQRVSLAPLASLQTWPAWSPRSEAVAYALGFGAASGIYQVPVDPAVTTAALLMDNPGDEWFLSWSPDGRDIAYLGNDPGNDEIYRVEAATGRVHRLTRNDHLDGPPAWVP